jgi:hypothetical protein
MILPSSPPQVFLLAQPNGMKGSVLENNLDVIVDNMK